MRKRVLEVVNHVDKVGAAPTVGGALGAARTADSTGAFQTRHPPALYRNPD